MPRSSSKSISKRAEASRANAKYDSARFADNAYYVVSLGAAHDPAAQRARLAEILSLVEAPGRRVAGHEIHPLPNPHPRTVLGKGTALAVAERARACGADRLVLDTELSPSQLRCLEELVGMPIEDREAVILSVFLRHARSRRARIQVEMAHLQYLRPRIRGVGLEMDQQTGGRTKARGPGETASELLGRKLDLRLDELRKALARLARSASTQRRRRASCARIALVGYTNAGKTSLMNALTGAGLSARDTPFETLDTTSRALARQGGDVVVGDTVGFIRDLPDRLLGSFASTFAEVTEASLLALVVDASDPEREAHLDETRRLIEQVGAGEVPRFYVFTKLDKLDAPPSERELTRLADGAPWFALSSGDAGAVADLEARLLAHVRHDEPVARLFVPYAAPGALASVYRSCRVLERQASGRGMRLYVQAPGAALAKVQRELQEAHRRGRSAQAAGATSIG